MSITRNAIVNLCKSTTHRPNVSRVCFTIAFRNPQVDGPRKIEYSSYNNGDDRKSGVEEVVEKTKEYAEVAKDKSKKAMNMAEDKTRKLKDKVTGMDDDVDIDNFIEDHVKKPARETDTTK